MADDVRDAVTLQDVPRPEAEQDARDDPDDAGIGMTSVVVMLTMLVVLTVGIYWGVPTWFGSQVIEITIRN